MQLIFIKSRYHSIREYVDFYQVPAGLNNGMTVQSLE